MIEKMEIEIEDTDDGWMYLTKKKGFTHSNTFRVEDGYTVLYKGCLITIKPIRPNK